MKVLILGAGVIGVTSAYLLGERGHEVTVIDRGAEPASECSHANGGQLSFSHAEPWANPLVLSKVFKWMLKKDSPIVLKPSLDPHMLRWTLSFLLNCQKNHCNTNSMNLLRLGLYSKQVMEKIRVVSGVEFDSVRNGILHIYTSEKDMHHAAIQADCQNKFSVGSPTMEVMDAAQCLQKEPALQYSARNIEGAVYCHLDECGDAGMFTRNLATICTQQFGVEFIGGTTVERLETSKGEITGVITDKGTLKADAYVMALGSYSYGQLKKIGIHAPIYPMKGYSVTLPAGDNAPIMSVTDNENKIVISRLGNRLRAAGTAEFAGYNTHIREDRIEPIIRAMKSLFPNANYHEDVIQKWACLRPSTPDGMPRIGRSKYRNLYLNTGHGTLGWTQAAGSANLLADIMESRNTEITMTGMNCG